MSRIASQGAADPAHFVTPERNKTRVIGDIGGIPGNYGDTPVPVILPGGHLPSLPDTLAAFNRAGLMLIEVENLWPHYQRTANEWRKNFAASWPEIQRSDPTVFTERFHRLWMMYMEGTISVFDDSLDLSHVIFTKGRSASHYPLLRGKQH